MLQIPDHWKQDDSIAMGDSVVFAFDVIIDTPLSVDAAFEYTIATKPNPTADDVIVRKASGAGEVSWTALSATLVRVLVVLLAADTKSVTPKVHHHFLRIKDGLFESTAAMGRLRIEGSGGDAA